MKSVPEVIVKGSVLSVTDKKFDKDGKPLDKPYRLVTLCQTGQEGDARTIELKSYNGFKAEVGKSVELKASVSCWAMKGNRGDIMSGLSLTIIEPGHKA